jgi:excisionase family DNA binding protein
MSNRTADLADRLALRPREAAAALGIAERTLRTLLPQIPHVRMGNLVLVPVDSLRKWLGDQTSRESDRSDAVVKKLLDSLHASRDDGR